MPDNSYVKDEYKKWLEEIKRIPDDLSLGIIHVDVGPKDFFFEKGEFTGIMDFNATHYGYFLSDVVSMMMYSELINPDRVNEFKIFMKNYLSTSPVVQDELQWIQLLLQARWFVQIFYHQYRYEESFTQGLESDDRNENIKGVTDGIEFLKTTNGYPFGYFYDLLSN